MINPDDPPAGLLAKVGEGDNSPAMSVGELSGALKRTIEDSFGRVRVRGEISGFKRHSSGHCYFTLKDSDACIDAVVWRGNAAGLAFVPEDGADVIATGKVTTYAGRSKYQIVIERMELAGEGALLALLEQRRKALAAEGLFDPGRKRPLPFMPRLIGVVTSPTGAVIRDILHRLADRFPTPVVLWPVPVQGEGAADKIAQAIRGLALLDPRPDLLIVARGGGSVEDLWAFNEEAVIRAAAESPIPLISAVGHETDTTLIDHAADRRAPTPTAAAEMAVPVRSELAALVSDLGQRSGQLLARRTSHYRERLDLTLCRWPDPSALFAPLARRADDLVQRLPRALGARAAFARGDFNAVAPRLRSALVEQRLARGREQLDSLWAMAGLVHPERPLGRGFARVSDAAGATIASTAAAAAARHLTLHFSDGRIGATVGEPAGRGGPGVSSGVSRAKVERAAARPYSAGQPGLFDDGEER